MSEETKNNCEGKKENPGDSQKHEKAQKSKKPKKDSECEKLKEELKTQKDLLMRTAAEFDNYKKRTEREKIRTAEYTKAAVIKQLLPVIDNAGRALCADPDSADYAKGIEMIVKQMRGIVDGFGLLELAEVGDPFNPEIHEAVMHCEDPERGENEIIAVLQQGYKIGDTVIRPAMVQVAN